MRIRSFGTLILALGALLVGACGGDDMAAPDPIPAELAAVTTYVAAVPGYEKSIRVRVSDGAGAGVGGVAVHFTVEPGHGTAAGSSQLQVQSDLVGFSDVFWRLPEEPGSYTITATATGDAGPLEGSPARIHAVIESFSPALDETLRGLGRTIANSLELSRQSLPLNPGRESEIDARIALVSQPDLDADIVASRWFFERGVSSLDGRTLPVTTVFPSAAMESGASRIADVIGAGLPVLEGFMDEAFPTDVIRVWYGFALGSRGGGGTLQMEDLESYGSVDRPLPYDAIVHHEVAHSYIGSEALTQFLELLMYNVAATGSTDPAEWSHTRGYDGPDEANVNVAAVLDIYQMLGYEATARAYRAIRSHHPRYGEPLCEACKRAFIDEAPEALRAAVAAKADRITM